MRVRRVARKTLNLGAAALARVDGTSNVEVDSGVNPGVEMAQIDPPLRDNTQ